MRDDSLNTTSMKIELLCRGARTQTNIDKGRKAGAGPTGGRYFSLPDGTCVEIPLQGKFVENSPFHLERINGALAIFKQRAHQTEVKTVPFPRFYEKAASDGTPMKKLAILHGEDCLASTIYSSCIHWSSGNQCKFCGIELGPSDRIMRKHPKELAEVAEEAFKEGAAKHVTLTTGTPPGSDKGAFMLSEAAEAIKAHVDLPIHVQLEPPNGLRFLEALHNAEVDTVGIHVESFDRKILTSVCPAKSDLDCYLKAWRSAVELFGEGQVSTFIIAGLGETDESIIRGSEQAASIGVVPYLLPLRPIAGTSFEKASPPPPERMSRLYRSVATILHKAGLDPSRNKAGCVRCGACSALKEAFICPP